MNKVLLVLLLVWPVSYVSAQTVIVSKPAPPPRLAPVKPAPYIATGKDTTPLNCERYKAHPHPMMVPYCQQLEISLVQGHAKSQGMPTPSLRVIELPASGSAEAKALGYACIGGVAMRKLPNGWEQVLAADGWQRCIGG